MPWVLRFSVFQLAKPLPSDCIFNLHSCSECASDNCNSVYGLIWQILWYWHFFLKLPRLPRPGWTLSFHLNMEKGESVPHDSKEKLDHTCGSTASKQRAQLLVLQNPRYFKQVSSPQGCQHWTFLLTGSHLTASHCLLATSTRLGISTRQSKSLWSQGLSRRTVLAFNFPRWMRKDMFWK